MSKEDIAICSISQMTFGSHEDTCVEIEEEERDVEMILEKENNSDNMLKMKKIKKKIVKKRGIFQLENSGNFTGEAKNQRERPKSPEPEVKIDVKTIEYQDHEQIIDNSNFEPSKQFIADIIKQVDELCENIKTGDPDTKRSEEVNLKLKSAVDCYRSKHDTEKEFFVETETVENYDEIGQGNLKIRRPWTDDEVNSKDSLHDSKVPGKKTKESKGPEEKKKEESMSEAIHNDIKYDDILPFLKFNSNENKFECSICDLSYIKRNAMYTHIRTKHENEIALKVLPNTKQENHKQCNGSVCKRVYGRKSMGKKMWCKKCLRELKLTEEMKKKSKAELPCAKCGKLFTSLKLLNTHKKAVHEKVPCSECGKLFGVTNIKGHMKSVHTPDYQKKFQCDTCGKGFINKQRFSEHLNSHTGEKPFKCTECIKSFVSTELLNRHFQSAHTPDDQKKFRCDTCGKGFINKQRLLEHLNIHTGEKPFICKFCPATFANSGGHAKHQRPRFCVLMFFLNLIIFKRDGQFAKLQFWNDKIYQNTLQLLSFWLQLFI